MMLKKISLFFLIILFCSQAIAQTTATNFILNDCSGIRHNLFSELDSGNIIVLTWAMPCGSCVGPSLAASSVVQKFASSHPGKVRYYLADDLANTNCATLSLWATSNEIIVSKVFSDAIINMWDYGTPGMPKTIAVAGSNHEVIFNQNSGVNVTTLANAINQRLSSGINDVQLTGFRASLYPNPLTDNYLSLKYVSGGSKVLKVDIYNTLGSLVKSEFLSPPTAGENVSDIDLSLLTEGVYFVRLSAGSKSQELKLIVNH